MIENIKLGIKLSLNRLDLLHEIYQNDGTIDFIEILLPPDFKAEDLSNFENLSLPYNFHLPHFTKRIDFGNEKQAKHNQEFIKRVDANLEVFNSLNPTSYIVYPESGDLQLSIFNLKKLNIQPLALENMPYKSLAGGTCLAHDPDSILSFFQYMPKLQFCLDLNHAVKTSVSFSQDYLELIRNFIKIRRPIHFHISDGNFTSELDEHLPLGKGEYDLRAIKNILFELGSDVSLTFETPRNNKHSIEEDLVNMKYFAKI
ncbi:MAG: sugar phosphate isomerase/epimerase [Candidatus Lokiarchaeota archaeon]|nr:sugar phosphate isomerase/epimerase [Candidatus Lokiarchaeota archaeon]